MIRTTAERRRTLVGAHRLREGLRFGVVGASSTILYFAAYSAGVLLGVPFALAAVVAFLASAAFGYMLHHRWTFRTNAASTAGLAQWLTLQGMVLLLNVLALWALIHQAGLNRLVAQGVLLPLIPLLTYALSRRHVFGAA